MKKFTMLIAIALLTQPLVTSAGSYSGANLNEWAQAYERTEAGRESAVDYQSAAMLIGYVAGIADVGNQILFCAPDHSTVGQLVAVTTKYVKEHPEKWDQAGATLVVAALREAFPCKK